MSAVCCLLPAAICCLMPAVTSLLSAVCSLLSAGCFLLSAVCCVLSAVCCLLSAVCCLLSAELSCPPRRHCAAQNLFPARTGLTVVLRHPNCGLCPAAPPQCTTLLHTGGQSIQIKSFIPYGSELLAHTSTASRKRLVVR